MRLSGTQVDADIGADHRKRNRQEESRPRCRRYRMDGQAVRSRAIDRHDQQGCSVSTEYSRGAPPMANLDQLKGTFFDECGEALQQIESGLSDLREGTASDDTINAVFRSVHSVKGGAGIFGFDDLVKFAHVL